MTEFINDKVPTEWQTECHKEAKTWRLPYWDFARFARGTNEIRLPIIATIPMVTINVFGSPVSTQRKSNPLYKFQTESLMGDLGIRDQGEEGPVSFSLFILSCTDPHIKSSSTNADPPPGTAF